MSLRNIIIRNTRKAFDLSSRTLSSPASVSPMSSKVTSVSQGVCICRSMTTSPNIINGQLNKTNCIPSSSKFGSQQHNSIMNRVPFFGGIPSSSQILISQLSQYMVTPVRHYQSILRPRLHCKGCYFVWRHGRKFVECSDVPSHKQMKKLPTRKVWLEDYSRGDVNVAMKWNRDLKRIADRHVDRTVMSHNWLASRIGKDV